MITTHKSKHAAQSIEDTNTHIAEIIERFRSEMEPKPEKVQNAINLQKYLKLLFEKHSVEIDESLFEHCNLEESSFLTKTEIDRIAVDFEKFAVSKFNPPEYKSEMKTWFDNVKVMKKNESDLVKKSKEEGAEFRRQLDKEIARYCEMVVYCKKSELHMVDLNDIISRLRKLIREVLYNAKLYIAVCDYFESIYGESYRENGKANVEAHQKHESVRKMLSLFFEVGSEVVCEVQDYCKPRKQNLLEMRNERIVYSEKFTDKFGVIHQRVSKLPSGYAVPVQPFRMKLPVSDSDQVPDHVPSPQEQEEKRKRLEFKNFNPEQSDSDSDSDSESNSTTRLSSGKK